MIGVILTDVNAKLPEYKSEEAAAADVYSVEDKTLGPGETKIVDLGLTLEIPEGFEVQVRARSGLSSKGILVSNSPGTIDSDYTGPCKVILTNTTTQPFEIKKGDRVAQFAPRRCPRIEFKQQEKQGKETARGSGGFGSTGK